MAGDYIRQLPEPILSHMQRNREYPNRKSFKLPETINNELREQFRNYKPKPLNEVALKKLRGFEYCESGRISNFFKGLGKRLGKFSKFMKFIK